MTVEGESRRAPNDRSALSVARLDDLFADLEAVAEEPVDEASRRFFRIAGLTVEVQSDRPFAADTFAPKFGLFAVDGPGEDTIVLRHHFGVPRVRVEDLGPVVARRGAWTIHHPDSRWIYTRNAPPTGITEVEALAVFTDDHRFGSLYNGQMGQVWFGGGGAPSLTLWPTDQVLLARVMADRQACYFHSCGAVLNGHGLLLIGHSGSGKSTALRLLQAVGVPLCDDRNVVRLWPDGLRVHGTWSHGTVPVVSAGSAPLRALLLVRKSTENRLRLIEDPREKSATLLSCLVKPLATADWWEKVMALVDTMARETPCYEMEFDLSGDVLAWLQQLCSDDGTAPELERKR